MASHLLENFIRETGQTLSRPPGDPKLLADNLGESVRRLLQGAFFLAESYLRPATEGPARHEIYRDPDGRFVLASCVWTAQQSTPIHDHAGVGVVAGIAGRVIMTSYRRLDDGLTPGYASLNEVSRLLISDTSHGKLCPPEDTIHRIENPYRETAVTLHLFGDERAGRSIFDPKGKTIVLVEGREDLFGV